MSVIISEVIKHSPAYKKGIKAGDTLLTINGSEVIDVLDYRFLENEEKLILELCRKNKIFKKKIVKKEAEELGLGFDTYLMDKQRTCKNKCIFCFIDQMPKGMRESLYFKDDDSRLSFLFGNYITLTNITEHEVERIIRMHISPINISVHTTNPELRVRMMKNKNAGEVLSLLERFNSAGISINCQLVLVPGYNDGAELERSLSDLTRLENVRSIAAVPVGLTGHREGLPELAPFNKQTASEVLDIIDKYAAKTKEQYGENRAFGSDEFYILSERPFPEASHYGEFLQLENGVGMSSLLISEVEEELKYASVEGNSSAATVVTGEAAEKLIISLVQKISEKFDINCSVAVIKNDFFGGHITVAGLITGQDIIKNLKGKPIGDRILIPASMLRHENDKFLDDVTVEELENELGVQVVVVGSSGADFVAAVLGNEVE